MEALKANQKSLGPTINRRLEDVAGSYTYFADGDVLLAKITPCFENGKLGIADKLTNSVGFGSSEFIVFRPFARLLRDYLYYFLSQESFRLIGERNMTGTAGQKRITKAYIEAVQIPVPPLREQERIVAILDQAFEGIAAAIANASRTMALSGELFLSVLESTAAAPGAYDQTNLGEEVELVTGFPFKSGGYTCDEGDVRLLRGDNIALGSMRWDDAKRWPKDNAEHHSGYELAVNDVVIAMDRTWIKGGIKYAQITAADLPCLLVQRTARLRCKSRLNPIFLRNLIGSRKFLEHVLSVQKGSGVPHISADQIRAFPFIRPPLSEQRRVADKLRILQTSTDNLRRANEKSIAELQALKQSVLHQAFSGDLTGKRSMAVVVVPFPITLPKMAATDVHAGVLAIAYSAHERAGKTSFFGHVKGEKIVHLVESWVGVDLCRTPVRDAAGPNDFPRLKKIEHRANKANFFSVHRETDGSYKFTKRPGFDRLVDRTRTALGDHNEKLDALLSKIVSWDSQTIEILATVFAAWNNLLIENQPITDEAIVLAARENWHPDKLNIKRERFFNAIEWMQKENIVPEGKGKMVVAKAK